MCRFNKSSDMFSVEWCRLLEYLISVTVPSAVSGMKVPTVGRIDTYLVKSSSISVSSSISSSTVVDDPPGSPPVFILSLGGEKKTSSVYPQYRFVLEIPKQLRTSVRFALPKRSPKSKALSCALDYGFLKNKMFFFRPSKSKTAIEA